VAEVRIANAAQLSEGETLTFDFVRESGAALGKQQGFVLRHRGELLAFHNECPHWSVELDLGDGHFYDVELDRIYCKNHGALFVLPSGTCETGPCLGRALTRFVVRADGQDAFVVV
jgi:nitrite reductase/ring-hydroxylating ferredoxin subunit